LAALDEVGGASDYNNNLSSIIATQGPEDMAWTVNCWLAQSPRSDIGLFWQQ
jgi:hypothetical protein